MCVLELPRCHCLCGKFCLFVLGLVLGFFAGVAATAVICVQTLEADRDIILGVAQAEVEKVHRRSGEPWGYRTDDRTEL
jgi:hypothetical protein